MAKGILEYFTRVHIFLLDKKFIYKHYKVLKISTTITGRCDLKPFFFKHKNSHKCSIKSIKDFRTYCICSCFSNLNRTAPYLFNFKQLLRFWTFYAISYARLFCNYFIQILLMYAFLFYFLIFHINCTDSIFLLYIWHSMKIYNQTYK